MIQEVTKSSQGAVTAPRAFRETVSRMAGSLLQDWVGEERAQEAAGRIATALAAAAQSARNPDDIYACTPESVGKCVAIAALSGIMPSSGAGALAYLIPRRPRKSERPQLNYHFSHRGLNALAARSGQIMVAIPISHDDEVEVTDEARVVRRDVDHPPQEWGQLRGVVIIVKSIESGAVITSQWVPCSIIERRRDSSDSYRYATKNTYAQATDPWHVWPVEMAMKTAMHYAVARGWCVLDDSMAIKALSFDEDVANNAEPPKIVDANVSKSQRLAESLTVGDTVSGGEKNETLFETSSDSFYEEG